MSEKKKIEERLLEKAFVMLALGFIGILLVIRGECLGEKGMLYASSVAIGLGGAMIGTMICIFVAGFKAGIKSKNKLEERVIEADKIKEIAREVYLGVMVGCATAIYYMVR